MQGGSSGAIRTHRNPLTPPSPLRGEGVKRRAHYYHGYRYAGGKRCVCVPWRLREGGLLLKMLYGTKSPRPTLTRAAENEPSGFLVAAGNATLAPGLSSLLSPTTLLMIAASGPTTIFFSPSLYLSITTWPSTLFTVVSTVAFVIVVLGRSHGRKPSPTPRCGSPRIFTRIAFWLPSACGVAPTPI